MRIRHAIWMALALLLLVPVTALAADTVVPPQHALALPTTQVWVIIAGALAPAVSYLINHYAPWVDEKMKAVVFVIVAAVAAGIAQAIDAGNVGFNQETLQLVVTAVIAAFGSHFGFFKASTIGPAIFKAGTNRQDA